MNKNMGYLESRFRLFLLYISDCLLNFAIRRSNSPLRKAKYQKQKENNHIIRGAILWIRLAQKINDCIIKE